MLTHGNMASNIACSLLGFDVRPGLISISFLPLCHVTARHVDFAMLYHGVTLAYCPFMDQLSASLAGGAAHHFCGSASGVRKDICAGGAEGERISQASYLRLGSVGGTTLISRRFLPERLPRRAVGSWPIKLVFSKMRQGMGGQVETVYFGRSAAGPRTCRLVRQRGHSHSRRLRPDRNVSGDRGQYSDAAPHWDGG